MKLRKNGSAYLFVLTLIFCMILNVPSFAATAPATTSQTETNFIDRFFTKEFTFLNKQGQDITDYFYETMTSKHEAGDYAAIENFLLENVSEAEACTKSFQPVARASTLRLMSVSRDFYKVVDDEIHGYEDWNAFYGEVELQYYVDTLTSTMTSAKKPIIVFVEMQRGHGDLDPTITVSNRVGSINSNGTKAPFSFHVRSEFEVYSDIYPEVNDLYLALFTTPIFPLPKPPQTCEVCL